LIEAVDLFEISVCRVPMNNGTRVLATKAMRSTAEQKAELAALTAGIKGRAELREPITVATFETA
jgi:phage head maturation protease